MTFKNIIKKIQRCAIFALLIISPQNIRAHYEISQTDADNRAKALKEVDTPTDSLNILMDVYSLSDKINREQVRGQILDVAQRTKDTVVLVDVIRELAASTDDTRELLKLMEISQSIPEEDGDKKSVETVLQMEHAKAEAENTKGGDLQNRILEYTKSGMSAGLDPYQEIQNIYKALVFLGTSSQGPLYLEYLTRLGDIVEKLPEKDHAIKNLYYTTAAIYYTRKRDRQNAIAADRKLLQQLQAMKDINIKNGRDTSDLDYFFYISYRRMLRNYKGLSLPEIEDIYAKCKQLAETNEKVKEEFGSVGLTNSYYFMATKQYSKAVPELNKALQTPDISKFRRMELTGLLARAYRETGDEKGELEALRNFTAYSLEDLRERREASYREIELRNEVTQLLAKEYSEAEKQHAENRVMRRTSVTLVYVLAVILIFLCRAYFKLRQKVKLLESGNKKLRTNIEQIFDNGMPAGTLNLTVKKHRLKG